MWPFTQGIFENATCYEPQQIYVGECYFPHSSLTYISVNVFILGFDESVNSVKVF